MLSVRFVPSPGPDVPTSSRAAVRPRAPRALLLSASCAALALLAASCGKDAAPSAAAVGTTLPPTTTTTEAPTTTAAPPPTAPPLPDHWPLTGQPGDPATIHATPVIAVKVDDNPQARPHSHITDADTVYELQVEGITRFMVLFNSVVPDRVGPVRSARSSDIDLFGNLHRPLLIWSGGNPGVTAEINAAVAAGQVIDAGQPGPASKDYIRDSRGRNVLYEHTLFTNPQQIKADFSPADETGPGPLFSFHAGDGDGLGAAALPAAGVTVTFNTYSTVKADYAWDASRTCWDRFQVDADHPRPQSAMLDEAGNQVCPQNVVVLFLTYTPDPVETRSPKATSTGTGTGFVFSNGKAVAINWSRPTIADGWSFTDAASGAPVTLTPGKTWVELPKAGQDQAEILDAGTAGGLLAVKH
jgi:hypothetical protein